MITPLIKSNEQDAAFVIQLAISTHIAMSSFSSVIRKPGGKIAPKAAPRRNVVRKTAQPQSQPATTPGTPSSPVTEALIATAEGSISTYPQSAREDVSQSPVAENDSPQIAQIPDAPVVASAERTQDEDTSVDGVHLTAERTRLFADSTADHIEEASAVPADDLSETAVNIANWPKQKSKPERNRSASAARRKSAAQPTATTSVPADDGSINTQSRPNVASSPSQLATAVTVSASAPRPRSKRKQQPRGSVDLMLAQASIPTPPATQPPPSPAQQRAPSTSSRRAASVASQRSEHEEALANVTSHLADFGNIIATIEANTSRSRSRTRPSLARSSVVTEDEDANQEPGQSQPRKRRKRNDGSSQTMQEQAAQVVANALGEPDPTPRGRRRHRTPPNPEMHEIEPQETAMGELLDPRYKWGKKSDKEKELEANWPEVLRRRRQDAALRLAAAQQGRRKKAMTNSAQQGNNNNSTRQSSADQDIPEMGLENGLIVTITREINRAEKVARQIEENPGVPVLEDLDIYRRVNSSTIASKTQIPPGQRWDDQNTEMFYQGLKMFGTDFNMIANMIPGKNRRQVKLKYNFEERLNWPRIQRSLGQKQEVDLEEYATLTGLEMSNVADVYKQMEEDEKRLREEDEARRREEGIISQDQPYADGEADVAIPSIEGPEGEATVGEGAVAGDRQSTAGVSRLGSTTTGRHTAQPPNKRKQTKKSASTTKRGRQAANKNKSFEGVEERLGDVGDVGIPG